MLLIVVHTPLIAAPVVKHEVIADGHPIVVWEKSVADSKDMILLHHGRTCSSLPNFDLQVVGENLSIMDGLINRALVFGRWMLAVMVRQRGTHQVRTPRLERPKIFQ
jgi:hypothetical protein